MEGLCGTGSAFSNNYTQLFQVSSDGVKKVLDYISSGFQSWIDHFTQDFDSRLMSCDVHNGITTVEVQFILSYYSGYDDSLLWRKQQKVVYTTNLATGALVLDRHQSDISEQEMKEIYENDTLSSTNILKYNFEQLIMIVRGTNQQHRQWLGGFLKLCSESAQKQRLQQLLDH